ncbi:DUF4157 domain-containing protein [Heliobacillus mobilis]|uniref:DUF4157 domain-containing protein n=2 Tax=Heliobacterium mobile TaxID=28064 RepID=A0A6I3SJE5_HELMO|nr:DUF4157 domain-containing protein [Heliobacterium mobile]
MPIQGKYDTVQHFSESAAPIYAKTDSTKTGSGVPINDDLSLEHEADVMGAKALQRVVETEEEETPVQGKLGEVGQKKEGKAMPNNTGLPDNLKAGVESLSGMSMDNVRVHFNSDKPAQVGALAYAQGTDIHVGPGQEQYLPHEAWHVVQQKEGRVRPTVQVKEVAINNDAELKREANEMVAFSKGTPSYQTIQSQIKSMKAINGNDNRIMQRMVAIAKKSISGDFIESNSIQYALERAGGPIGLLTDLKYNELLDGATLYIVAHGSKESSGEYTGEEIANILIKNGLKNQKNIEIIFTSCHAGEGKSNPKTDSVVAIIAQKLKESGITEITISGAKGLSIKSSATGDDFFVIKPDKESKYWPIQKALIDKYSPKKEFEQWVATHPKPTIEERAYAASQIARDFYTELVSEISKEEGLIYPNQEAISTIKINEKGELFYKERNMGLSPFAFDIEDYGSQWEKL